MANPLRIKRGTKATLPTLAAGEPGWCTDTFQFYVGDGAANHQVGGVEVTTVASSATPTPVGSDFNNMFTVTALAVAATFAAPTGTPANGNKLIIRIKDDATARALAWNAIYRAGEVALPTTTVISKTIYCGFIYNSADSKWDFVALTQSF